MARVYSTPPSARPERTETETASPVVATPPQLTPAQARRAVAAENAAAANPHLDDATALGLQALVRRAQEAAARPGARLDVTL